MGLAPYGDPKYVDKILENLIDIKEDGSFRLNNEYFNYATGFTMTNKKFENLFGEPVRNPIKNKITQFHMDVAASIQKVTEQVMTNLVKSLKKNLKLVICV